MKEEKSAEPFLRPFTFILSYSAYPSGAMLSGSHG
jgi:hypothetical protein